MKVDLYEKIWMVAAVVLLVVFVGSIVGTAALLGMQPPSHVETIDPMQVRKDPRFAETGVFPRSGGGIEVRIIAQMYGFFPPEFEVPARVPVTFRLTSADVIHGFQIIGTNANTMVVPGYVSQFSTRFDRPGEYLIVCNEYCGVGHHVMSAKLTVTEGGR